MTHARYVRVAIDTPLRQVFDYLLPPHVLAQPGMRVRVPFGRREVVGLVLGIADATEVPDAKLRAAIALLDAAPLLGPQDLALLEWAANYYHHPIGQVFATALPKGLRVVRKRAPRGNAAAQAAVASDVVRRETP